MDVARVLEILRDCIGSVNENKVPTEGCEVVDVWVLVALKTAKVHEHEAEMIKLLKDWPTEAWVNPSHHLARRSTTSSLAEFWMVRTEPSSSLPSASCWDGGESWSQPQCSASQRTAQWRGKWPVWA